MCYSLISAHSLKSLHFYKTAIRGWKNASKLTSAEALALQVPPPEQPTLLILRDNLENLREDYAELRTQVDLIHSEMGLLGKKLDALIRMRCKIHHGAWLAVPFTLSDLDHGTHAADRTIHSNSSDHHFI